MKPRQSFVQLVFFTVALAAATACMAQANDIGDGGWRVNQHWWGAYIPAHRLIRSARVTYDGVASVSFPDKVMANVKKHTEFAIGIKHDVFSRQRVFLAKFPAEFGHGGDQINLASKSHQVTLQWEIDGKLVISVGGGQRNGGSILIEENSTPNGNFDALLTALRRGNTGRLWLVVDGRPRFSYVISLIGFSAAWGQVMGDWRE